MYSGVVVVARLAGLLGLLLYVLIGMAVLAPLVFSVTVLLLDLNLSPSVRFQQPTILGIATFKTTILDVVPLGLLLCWSISQCRVSRRDKSSREMSSNLIAAALILLHIVGLAQYVVYVISRLLTDFDLKVTLLSRLDVTCITLQLLLLDWDLGLTETTFLLACLALPWMWLLGLAVLPPGHSGDQLDRNLKLASYLEAVSHVLEDSCEL